MPTLLLVRHGRTTANASGILAGRAEGVELDKAGRQQAGQAGRRIASVRLAALVVSPLVRCQQTAAAIVSQQPTDGVSQIATEERITECDYGQWQGKSLAELSKLPLWTSVQRSPSTVQFPGGETMIGMQQRAVAAIADHDRAVREAAGDGAVWAAVSHGDVIKAVLADALGMRLDDFQRIDVHPASISVIRYSAERPMVHAMNTSAGELDWLQATAPLPTVGGGAGPRV